MVARHWEEQSLLKEDNRLNVQMLLEMDWALKCPTLWRLQFRQSKFVACCTYFIIYLYTVFILCLLGKELQWKRVTTLIPQWVFTFLFFFWFPIWSRGFHILLHTPCQANLSKILPALKLKIALKMDPCSSCVPPVTVFFFPEMLTGASVGGTHAEIKTFLKLVLTGGQNLQVWRTVGGNSGTLHWDKHMGGVWCMIAPQSFVETLGNSYILRR